MDAIEAPRRDFLWVVLFLIVLINGFEAGGYQASIWHIGEEFDLSLTSMGLFAAMELFATMLAPILLGKWADSVRKSTSITIMLGIQIAAALIAVFAASDAFFLFSIFFLGLTTSALQFISIAAVADAYPVSGGRKVAYITMMYALGALLAPLVVDFYLQQGLDWRTLFGILAIGSVCVLMGIVRCGGEPREARPAQVESRGFAGRFVLSAILLLSVIMCIYVGFENGFTYFVDTLFTDVLQSSNGKIALSIFWAVMIPSRFLVGRFDKHAKKILIAAIITIPCAMLLLSASTNPAMVIFMCVPLGFASGAIYPCVLTVMLPFAGKQTATATGIITAATGIGGVAFTALMGFMADSLGVQNAMLALVSFFILSLVSALIVIKRSNVAESA
ncbi:MAG: MFS transporter [Eggerthellaceae bacterium]|nr:MFS transporter [Eggerthellaceae bacterium]